MFKIALFILSLFFVSKSVYCQNNLSIYCNEESSDISNNYRNVSQNIQTNTDTLFDCGLDEKTMNPNNLSFLFWLSKRSELLGDFVPRDESGESLCLWNIKDGKRTTLFNLGEGRWIPVMSASHNEDIVAVSVVKNNVTDLKCYSLNANKWMWEIKDLDVYWSLSFSKHDEELIAFGNEEIYFINSKTGKVISKSDFVQDKYPLDEHKATSVYFSSTGRYIVIWQYQVGKALVDLFRRSANKNISVFDIKNKKLVASLPLKNLYVETACFTADDKHLFLGCSDGKIKYWSLEKNKIIKEFSGNAIHLIASDSILVAAVQKKPVNLILPVGSDRGNYDAAIWKYPNIKFVNLISPFSTNYMDYGIVPIVFDPTGKFCAIERGEKLFLYNTTNWKVIWCELTDIKE